MLEVLYRIYEVPTEEERQKNLENKLSFGLYESTSKAENNELLMDCLICESRDQFKAIIRSMYGEKIGFRYSKKLQEGDLYCIIIGEHCYDTNKYFDKIRFKCDCCGAEVETYYSKPIGFSPYEIRNDFYDIQDYADKHFCSMTCKQRYRETERARLHPADDQEFFITREMFDEPISGYIYIIRKKSTGEFYVGQTKYAPIFRWGQHLKTERFPIGKITDYAFEVLEIVPKGENILEREKYYIQKYYREDPERSLNIACTGGLGTNDQVNLLEEMEANG